jgi:hypothetical protein
VAIKAHIHALTFFLPSLLFLPFLLNKQDRYIHILHVPLSRLLPTTSFCSILAFEALLTTAPVF